MATQSFLDFINDQSYETLTPLWNEYAAATGDGEQIYDSIEEVADFFADDAAGLARAVFFGDLHNWGDNVFFNGYGNIESCWSVESSPIVARELAQWLEDSNHEFFQAWVCEQEE